MLFSSIVFLFTFLPAVMILYYLLPVRFRNVIPQSGFAACKSDFLCVG